MNTSRTAELLALISNPEATREHVAMDYAMGLRDRKWKNFIQINRAIVQRWSVSTLMSIKKRAYALLRCHN